MNATEKNILGFLFGLWLGFLVCVVAGLGWFAPHPAPPRVPFPVDAVYKPQPMIVLSMYRTVTP